MKLFIIALLAVMPFFATAQQLYGTGVGYVNGTPTFTPNISQKGSELCVSLNRKMLYLWNRDSAEWKPLGGITVTFGAPIAAPAPVGGTRTAINMQTGLIYWWDGSNWKEVISYSVELASAYAATVAELYANEVRAELADSMIVARAYADTLFANITFDSLVKSATLSGFLAANSIPYVDNNGRLNARGFQEFAPLGSAPGAPGSGFRVFANGAGNMAVIRADGYVTTFDFSTATGNRFFTYPANAGTFGILENTQSWTGLNTFSPTGTGGAGFVYSSTTRPSHPLGTVTTSQRDAMTGMAAGDLVYNGTFKRINLWDVSWLAVPTMASGGIGDGHVVRGDANGNVFGSTAFIFRESTTGTFPTNLSISSISTASANNQAVSGAVFEVSFNNSGAYTGLKKNVAAFLTDDTGGASIAIGRPYATDFNTTLTTDFSTRNFIIDTRTSGGSIFLRRQGTTIFTASATEVLANTGDFESLITKTQYGLPTHFFGSAVNTGGYLLFRDGGATGYKTAVGHDGDGNLDLIAQRANTSIVSTDTKLKIYGSNGFFRFGNSGTATSFAHFAPPASNVTGDLSGAGYGLRFAAATYTNTTSTVGATVSSASLFSIEGGTVAATNGNITYTALSTLRIAAPPTRGTNVTTGGSLYALTVDSGHSRFNETASVGNGTSTYTSPALTIANRGDSDGLIFVSYNNPNGAGSVGPPSLAFFRSLSSSVSTQPFFRIKSGATGSTTFSGDPNGDGTAPNNWISFSHTLLSLIPSSHVSVVNTGNTGSIILGAEPSAATAPSDGFIYSGRKINGGASDIAGSDLYIRAGYGTGLNVNKGNLIFQTPDATTSGATLQAYTTKFNIGRTSVYSTLPTAIGATSVNAAALLDLVATNRGLLIPRATTAQINAVTTPPLGLQMISTTDERIHLKRTDGFYQVAYVQDIKRDSFYRVVNGNLDLSGLTTTFQNRFKRVIVETIVTAAATGNNTITMPVPSAALLGVKFEISVEDTSGDSDISVLSFGTDGTDGYLYNGDGTYASSQNLFPGLGVYVSVSWCEAKGAYRWKLQ